MYKKTNWLVCSVLALALLMAACGGAQKEATDAAVNAAQAAITAAQGEAAKYVPDQLKAAQDALQAAKDAIAKGDYAAALSAAQDAASKAKDLAGAAAAKKEDWTKNWADLSGSFPKSLDEAKTKLDAYSKGAHMPAGMNKASLADAKDQYAQLKQGWADAAAAFQQGDIAGATQKAAGLKAGLAKLLELLGIKS